MILTVKLLLHIILSIIYALQQNIKRYAFGISTLKATPSGDPKGSLEVNQTNNLRFKLEERLEALRSNNFKGLPKSVELGDESSTGLRSPSWIPQVSI